MTISDENKKNTQGIVRLAIKCMFINAQEEDKILASFTKRGEQEPAYTIIEFFKEENILSEQKTDFLLAFKKYLDTQAFDTEFGALAIANNFVTKEAIKDAIDFQKEYYSKTEKTKEISEILLKKKQITLQNSTAVLLAQDRIGDDILAQALDNLASSQIEKNTINKRFGVLALKRDLISLEQLNQALASQQGEVLIGQKRRHLHEILEESAGLSEDDTISILIEQKQFEKRRLNLEEALSTYKSSIKLSTKLNLLFQYRISKTGLEAYVSKLEDLSEEVKMYQFIAWLKQAGINYGIVDDKTIEDFLFNKKTEEEIIIAKGYLPVNGVNETIEFMFDTNLSLPDEQLKDEQLKQEDIPLVKKDDILARIIPGKKGKPGKDVCGNIIYTQDFKTCSLDSGEGVTRKDLVFIADVDGIPSLRNKRTLLVSSYPETSQTHIISKNIEANTKETYKSLDLEIHGIIGQDAIVTCQNLILNGDALGNINATGDVQIKGSIGEIEKTDKEVNHQPTIFAAGDIIVKKNISNARLETTKELIAPNGEIVSSEVIAANGIILKSVIFNKNNPSVLQIGKKPDPKINKIDNIIQEKVTKLRELKHEEELEKIKNKYQKQMEMEKEYLEKNNVLKDVLKKIEDSESESIQGLKQNQYPKTTENEEKNKYILEVVKEVNRIDLKDQKTYIEKMLSIESDMYKAAKEATQKMSDDNKVKYKEIEQAVKENMSEIENIEIEIETLSMGKDFQLSKQEKSFPPQDAMIKIKDQIAKGTVIKGQTTEMIIKETMYGVQFMEVKGSHMGETKILVKGYFS